jgi:ZIP family zinc transporter
MSFLQTLIFGSISGLTILLGLPLARLRPDTKKHIAFLNAMAIGILLFLFYDVSGN